jgi:type I restriction-modification system DNA methylase subunit
VFQVGTARGNPSHNETLMSANVETSVTMTKSVIMEALSGTPAIFKDLLVEYHSQVSDAVRRCAHHDHRRALLMDFLRKTFGIEVDEIELEKKIKVAEARGRIDAFYKYVIFEIKIDLDRERDDAIRELKKYFESRSAPSDYIAAVTDGLTFEIFDYDAPSKEPKHFRTFQIDPDRADLVYLELDELLASGSKIPPSSDDIVGRFGLRSTTFLRSLTQLEEAFTSVESDSSVAVKFREWNALLAKVYGSAVGDKQLFLRHTYLTILSRAIVTMALFPKHHRGSTLYRDLLTGKFFRDQSILNLAEPDFFSWALDTVADQPFNDVFHAIFRRLEEFDWTKLDEDLLKMLYQELIDPADRSGLGEYYTPDWLAEMILEDIGYDGGSLLDPSCGSGTFLFCAIRRLKRQGLTGDKLIHFAMDSLVGLDVHPVAVLMAKANILLALASELKQERDFDIQLRVYMADTLHTDEKKHKNFLGVAVGDGREFAIPLKSLELDRDLDLLVNQMVAFANRGTTQDTYDAARKGFLSKLAELTTEEQNLWRINYELMVDLVRAKRDTVWGFILKNAFRPAYLRKTKVDVIVGNPPWLSYRDIAEQAYRDRIKSLVHDYNLIDKQDGKLVTRLDTSTLFYVHCQHEFLKEGGTIAFVMPKTVMLPSKQHINFQRDGFSKVHDLGKVTVVGAVNLS